ncbi:hypothetical protein KXV35_007858, partial [Aspergillus fumigatus]
DNGLELGRIASEFPLYIAWSWLSAGAASDWATAMMFGQLRAAPVSLIHNLEGMGQKQKHNWDWDLSSTRSKITVIERLESGKDDKPTVTSHTGPWDISRSVRLSLVCFDTTTANGPSKPRASASFNLGGV